LRIRDVYPKSRILILTHPGSRLSDPGSRISDPGSRISDPGSRIPEPKTARNERDEENFVARKNLFRIPDPGIKKAPDPGSGSATLLLTV
jgi:hypothetical protein